MSGSTMETVTDTPQTRSSSDIRLEARMQALTRLSEALQSVYQRCPDLPVLGIRWMHLKHPLHEIQEALLDTDGAFGETGGRLNVPSAVELVGQLARCVVFGGYLSVQLIRLRFLVRRQVRVLARQRFEVVARTCCFESDRPADGSDFYFGDLQQRLAGRGFRMLLLCGDGTGGKWLRFAKGQAATSGLCRMPELALVHPLAPLRMAGMQLWTSCSLLYRGRELSTPLARRISRLASRSCLSQETTLNGLMFWVGSAAARRWQPKAFLTLYEGHAWEACLRLGVKSADGSCRTVGYQHTMVFRESLALTASSGGVENRSVPDVVLGLGEAPLELMRAGHARSRTRMVRFGSFRYHASGVLRPANPDRRTILVTPEGIPSEVQILLTFAVACAKRLPSYTFVLRCHPQVPIAKALALVPEDLTRQPNVILSERRSIEEEFARASILLYRGSSSVMYGILHGLLPVYLHHGASDRDPLYTLQAWRRRCASVDACVQILREHEQASGEQLAEEWAAAAAYVNDYTGPVTDDHLDAFLDAVGLTHHSPCTA